MQRELYPRLSKTEPVYETSSIAFTPQGKPIPYPQTTATKGAQVAPPPVAPQSVVSIPSAPVPLTPQIQAPLPPAVNPPSAPKARAPGYVPPKPWNTQMTKEVSTIVKDPVVSLPEDFTIIPEETIDPKRALDIINEINDLSSMLESADGLNTRRINKKIELLKREYQELYLDPSLKSSYEKEQPPNQPPIKEERGSTATRMGQGSILFETAIPEEIKPITPEEIETKTLTEQTELTPVRANPNILTQEQQVAENEQKRLDTISQRRFAIISKATYDMYENGADIAGQNVARHLPNHIIDKELSDKETVVFIRQRLTDETPEVILGIRGSRTVSDWVYNNPYIARGVPLEGNSQRYANAENKLKQVLEKYPTSKVIITGHSLGGVISAELSKKYDIEGHAFNIGSSPMSFLNGFPDTENQLTVYTVLGDPISISHYLGGKDRIITTAPPSISQYMRGYFGHDISLFLPNGVLKYELENINPTNRWLVGSAEPAKPLIMNRTKQEYPTQKKKCKRPIYKYTNDGLLVKICID